MNKNYEEAIIKMLTVDSLKSKYLFYAHIISQCKIEVSTSIDTLGVGFVNNRYRLSINPDYFDSLPINHAFGVLKHEALHILYKHTVRTPEENYHTAGWNYACDIAINQHIKAEDLPEGALSHVQYELPEDLTAEQYYFLLKEQHDKKESEKSEKSDNNENSDATEGSSGQQNPQDPFDINEEGQDILDEHDWDSCKGVPQDILDGYTADMIEKSMNKAKGNVPINISDMLSLFKQKSVLDWRKLLRRYTGNKRLNTRSTIKRRNRRFPNRPDVPGKTKGYSYEVLTVVDVSGSMSDSEIYKGLTEINSICKLTNSDMRIIQVDSKAYESESFNVNQKTWERKASGGTVLYPAIEQAKLEKLHYDVLIVISDMGIFDTDRDSFNALNVNQIWLSTTSEHNPFSTTKIRVFSLNKDK